MLKPKCGFYLREVEGSKIKVEIYDRLLLEGSIGSPEFSDCCKDLAEVYKMKPEDVEGLVFLTLFFEKAKKKKLPPQKVIETLKSLGFKVEIEREH